MVIRKEGNGFQRGWEPQFPAVCGCNFDFAKKFWTDHATDKLLAPDGRSPDRVRVKAKQAGADSAAQRSRARPPSCSSAAAARGMNHRGTEPRQP